MQKQVVDFNGEAVGAIVPDKDHFRFVAVKYAVWSLDGQVFSSPEDANQAVQALMSRPNGQAMPIASFWVPGEGDPPENRFNWNAASALPDKGSPHGGEACHAE
ncbi:hypothetical protein [Rhizobium sp. Root482]|uniref:hypothetical protein n=1 Tax=Rhizobium sp. Root482 TaxID=1736543 RepID=UPI000A9DE577|nr:hypothetical protein [Rhizobium sp. Root482]